MKVWWILLLCWGCSSPFQIDVSTLTDAGEETDGCPSGEALGAWGVPDRCDPTASCTTITGSLCYQDGSYTGSSIARCRPGTLVPDTCVSVGQDMWCC